MVFSAEGRILIKVWPANSPDLNLVDYCISGGNCKSMSTATGFVTRIS